MLYIQVLTIFLNVLEFTIHRCGLECRKGLHYYCLYCPGMILRRDNFELLLHQCKETMTSGPTPPLNSGPIPPVTSGPILPLSSGPTPPLTSSPTRRVRLSMVLQKICVNEQEKPHTLNGNTAGRKCRTLMPDATC